MSLSSNIKNSSEPACLRATGSGVEYIDKLPHSRTNCIKLCLSYNSISSLENITQFKRLNVLLIQYNLISTFEALSPLKELRYLQTLHLEGNPVCDLALFDIHVISMLPSLQLLNGKRTKDILELKDLRYIDYEAELLEQILHINFVYEVFKYVVDTCNRENITFPEENKRGNKNNSSSNTPSRSNKSAVIKSSSPASVSSKQNKSPSSHPNNSSIFDLIKEAIRIKRAQILSSQTYKIELANSLRKNKFNDDGYISFLRLEVLRCDDLIEESITNLIKFMPQPSSPSRKYSVTSTPSKSPASISKDSSRQPGSENAIMINDEIESFRSILSDLKGEEDFTGFVAQQDDLQSLSFKMMGIIGGMDFDKIGVDASIGYNLTPTSTPKKRRLLASGRNKKYYEDVENYEEEEIDDNFNIAMTPSVEARDEKPGFAQKAPVRKAKTPAVSKKKNASNIENSPDQKVSINYSNKSSSFTTPQKDTDGRGFLSNQTNGDENSIQDENDDEFLFEKGSQSSRKNKKDETIPSNNKAHDKNQFEIDNEHEIQDLYDENEDANKDNKVSINIYLEEEEEENEKSPQQQELEKQWQQQQKEKEEQERLRKQQEQEKLRKQKEQQLKQEQERQRQQQLLQKQQKEKEEQERLRKQQEQERIRKQEEERQRQLLQQQKEKEEQERLQKQKEEEERQRQIKQEQERQRQQQLLQQQKEKEEQEKLRKQKEQQLKQEQERQRQQQLLQQQKEKEEQEKLRKQKEQQLKQEQERQRQQQLLQQQKEKEEQERLRKQQEEEERQRQLKQEQERQRQLQLQKEQEEQKRLRKQQEEEERQRQQKLLQQKKEQEEQERLRKQQEEEERQRQLKQEQERQRQQKLLQQKKEQEEQERLRKQQEEEERQRQLKQEQERQRQQKLLQQKKEQERQERLRKQQEEEEKERQRQQQLLQQKKEQEEQEKLRKQQEEEERQRQLKQEQERQKQQKLLQKKKEQEEQERLQKQQEEEERQKQLREKQEQQKLLQRQKELEEEEERAEKRRQQLQQKQQHTPKHQRQQRNRPNESDGEIDSDIQEIVKTCDTLNINSSDLMEEDEDKKENESKHFANDQFEQQEEEEEAGAIIPIDMNQISFEQEIFSSNSSDNEDEGLKDRHENVSNSSSKRVKKIGYDENQNSENISNDDLKEKEREKGKSIANKSYRKEPFKPNSSKKEEFQPENQFEIEEEEEDFNDEINKSATEQAKQNKKVDISPLKASTSLHSNRNSVQNANSYSHSSSACNFEFQEPLLSTGEKEEEEEEQSSRKLSKHDSQTPKKCSIVVGSNTPISITKETRGSSSECAEYLESGPDDEEESNNQSSRSKIGKHFANKSHHQWQKEENERSQQKGYDSAKKNIFDQEEKFNNYEEDEHNLEDHESNDLNNYVDNTATLSFDEKMQASKDEEEEDDQYQQFSANEKVSQNQDADNGFDYSLDENEIANENNNRMTPNSHRSPRNHRDNIDNDNNDVYNFPFTNASSDLRLGAFASSEKLNNSEENADNFNYMNSSVHKNKVKSSILPGKAEDEQDDVDDIEDISSANDKNNNNEQNVSGILNANLSEDSDSFQQKMMNLIPQSIRKITEPEKQEQESYNSNKHPKRTILFTFDRPNTSNNNAKDSKREGNEINNSANNETDGENLINGEIDELNYDASRGESMSSNKEYHQRGQKSKQKRNHQNQFHLNDFADGTKFDAESGGLTPTPLQSPEYPNSSFQNRFESQQDQDNSSFYQTRNKKHNSKQSINKSHDNVADPKSQKRNHFGRDSNLERDNDDYYSYADESRDFYETDSLYVNNNKRIGDSKNDLANFGSNDFEASNGGIDTTNVESNEPHWLNSCDDAKFDASYGGAYDSAQPSKNQKLRQQRKRQNQKQDIMFNANSNYSNQNYENDNDFISHDQSTENELQHQVRFANAHSHKQQPNQKQQSQFNVNKRNQVYGGFTDSNSDLLNDEIEEDEDDQASSSRAATSAAFSSSINPNMKNSNSYLNITQDNASSSRPEPDSDTRLKSDSRYEMRRKDVQIIPTNQLFVCKYFNTWKSKVNYINQGQIQYPESTLTAATINDSYVPSSRNSFVYYSLKNNSSNNSNNNEKYSLKQMSEKRDLLRKIEMQKDINKALQARLNQIEKEREVSTNYSMAFEWPPSSRPSSPLASKINSERICYQQTQQIQQQQKQKRKKERTPDLFTQYRNHVMSSSVKKE